MADAVIVVMHVGEEYNQDVDAETQEWVDVFLEEGVDIVIGSHPHVVRTMEILTREDGHKMLVCIIPFGKFPVHAGGDLPSLAGGDGEITIKKDIKTGEIQIPKQNLFHF